MSSNLRSTLVAYGFLLPALILLGVYTFYPMVFGTYLAFTKYNVITPPQWVGLANFRELFQDTYFWSGLWNAIRYVLVVPAVQFSAIGIALLLNRKLPLIGLFRASYYIPVVTSFSVVGLMWGWMYDQHGAVNYVIQLLGLSDRPVSLLSQPSLALYAVMFVTLWKGIGYYMVLYLAGLQSIDPTFEEAALIDGASRWRIFWNITLPLLRPTILLCTLLSTLAAIKIFEEIFVMTGGGPAGSTYTVLYYVYSKAFQDFRFGMAAAASLVVAGVSLVFSIINFKYIRGGTV